MPLCAAHPGCRNFGCVPSTQHSRIPDAKLPQMPAARAMASRVETQQPARPDTSRRTVAKSPDGMKAAPVKLAGRDAADAARDLVADGDGRDQIPARDARRSPTARARPRPTGCSCARSTRCACRRTRAPARTRRSRTPPSSRRRVRRSPKMRHGPGGDIATAASRTDRPNGVSAPASARPMTSSIARASSHRRHRPADRRSGRACAHAARSAASGIRIESSYRIDL